MTSFGIKNKDYITLRTRSQVQVLIVLQSKI